MVSAWSFTHFKIFFHFTEYWKYFGPDFSLNPEIFTKQDNQNTRQVTMSFHQYFILFYENCMLLKGTVCY